MTTEPFSNTGVDLKRAQLKPITAADAQYLGEAIAAIPPWSTLSYPAAALTDYLSRKDSAARRFTIMVGDEIAGVVCVRTPWLKGPYLELLAILPAFQRRGIGSDILDWMEREAREYARNLWVIASSFNSRAIAFYEAHGFAPVANLNDLTKDGFTEILMRKRLA